MPRFFVSRESIVECNGETHIIINGEDAHHISRALRMAVGEKIEVCDFNSTVYDCELIEFNDKDVVARVISQSLASSEPKHKITLYQSLPKGDKMETIIQKSTECGACRFVPFRSEFCIVKLDSKDGRKKQERWQKIAESAAKQSGRGIIPNVCEPMDFKAAVEDAMKASLVIFCNERETEKTLKDALCNKKYSDISIIIGSEGGFSQKEAEYITSQGAISVTLGKRILRCETAPTFVLSAIAYETEM
ncbi:MAG: 16S rRNA (uracil(1498)-N(3))-methyltransferase [Clostridia bacterium]|nr:16S rRNA (uracil(1498)-N(3))-methyltransferase [Clostridia bacterium]